MVHEMAAEDTTTAVLLLTKVTTSYSTVLTYKEYLYSKIVRYKARVIRRTTTLDVCFVVV